MFLIKDRRPNSEQSPEVCVIYYQTSELIHFGLISQEAVSLVVFMIKMTHSCVAFAHFVFHVSPANEYLAVWK